MGRTWVVGDVVLKPVDHDAEHAWVCEVYDAWSSDAVGVPRPLRAGIGWSVDGWGAHVLLPGSTTHAGDDPDWFRGVHDAFHEAVAGLPRPAFLDARRDAWSYGDRVAWEGVAPVGGPRTTSLIGRALDLMEPIDLPSQVVHGDLAGNVLRDDGRAAVIDWPPYWRPRAWALAVVATDVITWEGADPTLLDEWSDGPAWRSWCSGPPSSGWARARSTRRTAWRSSTRTSSWPARPRCWTRWRRDCENHRMSDHYFSADPSVPFAREPLSCEVWGQRLDLVSGSGVYSRGRLDIGTSVLFRETDHPPRVACSTSVPGTA